MPYQFDICFRSISEEVFVNKIKKGRWKTLQSVESLNRLKNCPKWSCICIKRFRKKFLKDTSKFQMLQLTNEIFMRNSFQKSSAPLWPWNHLEHFFAFLLKENWGFHYSFFALALNLRKSYVLFKAHKHALS